MACSRHAMACGDLSVAAFCVVGFYLSDIGYCVAGSSVAKDFTIDWPGGNRNPTAAQGNPLRGMLGSPDWHFPYLDTVPSSLEYYYIPWNKIMNDDVSDFSGFDSYLEPRLQATASRAKHAVVRFFMDYPTKPSTVPSFLISGGLQFNTYTEYGGGQSPSYSDANLLAALQAFIAGFGARYDGDPRIGFIQVGLLGFWGEWHTHPHDWIPASTKDLVVIAFDNAFKTTQLNLRVPHKVNGRHLPRMGLHDDSFAFSTLDGPCNGDVQVAWFFWPKVIAEGMSKFWQESSMGGELRPELQSSIFDPSYPANTANKQDYTACVEVTHASYMLNQFAFTTGYSGIALERAQEAALLMGYRFVVPSVNVSFVDTDTTNFNMDVLIANEGVAPFYYPLNITLSCVETELQWTQGGVEAVKDGQEDVFRFEFIPATEMCLGNLSLSLESPFAYPERPVRFAQGSESTASLYFAIELATSAKIPKTTSTTSTATTGILATTAKTSTSAAATTAAASTTRAPAAAVSFSGSISLTATNATKAQLETAVKATLAVHFDVDPAKITNVVARESRRLQESARRLAGSWSVSYTLHAAAEASAAIQAKAANLVSDKTAFASTLSSQLTSAGAIVSGLQVHSVTAVLVTTTTTKAKFVTALTSTTKGVSGPPLTSGDAASTDLGSTSWSSRGNLYLLAFVLFT